MALSYVLTVRAIGVGAALRPLCRTRRSRWGAGAAESMTAHRCIASRYNVAGANVFAR